MSTNEPLTVQVPWNHQEDETMKKMKRSESKSGFSALTRPRATSIMTFDSTIDGSLTSSNEPLIFKVPWNYQEDETMKTMKRSESRSGISALTRATSMMTFDSTIDGSLKTQRYYDEEMGEYFPLMKKKVSFSGFILPTVYGSTGIDSYETLSECSYNTGIEDDISDSDISYCVGSEEDEECNLDPSPVTKLHEFKENIESSSNIKTHEHDSIFTVISKYLVLASQNVKSKASKVKGAKRHQPAPQFPISECAWTFTGSFIIIFLLSYISINIPFWNDKGHAFPLGPFGALTTLQYSLGDAPPAQPRSVILGSTLAGCIALCFSYIPETIMSIAVRIAFATSTSIAMMALLGIMHPPGGAIALVFAMGGYHWGHLLLTLCGCYLAIFVAVIINNLNGRRQYPQYWHFGASFENLFSRFCN